MNNFEFWVFILVTIYNIIAHISVFKRSDNTFTTIFSLIVVFANTMLFRYLILCKNG